MSGMDVDEVEEEEVSATAEEILQDLMENKNESELADVPNFPALTAKQVNDCTYQRVNCPPHRYTPLRAAWDQIYQPIVEHMKILIRFNPKKRIVELKTSELTLMPNALQKSADFVRAFMLGFEVRDAIALLRLDDLYIDSFEVTDVKIMEGEHLSRAIGRVAGQAGKTKYTIENATKTRIVLADSNVHILGSYSNIRIAKSAVVRLILGSPSGKVYTQMRAVANRMKDRF
jgi:RNA-binding protein PNO1